MGGYWILDADEGLLTESHRMIDTGCRRRSFDEVT
jgi:hypothetical protein